MGTSLCVVTKEIDTILQACWVTLGLMSACAALSSLVLWNHIERIIEEIYDDQSGSVLFDTCMWWCYSVGDPFKDTAGPSLHVLIKMLATITLVMAPLFLES